jgi:hypothetical protein
LATPSPCSLRKLSPGGWGAPRSYAGSVATLPLGSQLPLYMPGARVVDPTGHPDDENPPSPAGETHVFPRPPALNHPLPPGDAHVRAEKRKAPTDDGADALWKRTRPTDPYSYPRAYAGSVGSRVPSLAHGRPVPPRHERVRRVAALRQLCARVRVRGRPARAACRTLRPGTEGCVRLAEHTLMPA